MDSRLNVEKVIWHDVEGEKLKGKRVYAFDGIHEELRIGTLIDVDHNSGYPFFVNVDFPQIINRIPFKFIHPVPEPISSIATTYTELQKVWVEKYKVKVGTQVCLIKNFESNEGGSASVTHENAVGKKGVVVDVRPKHIAVRVNVSGQEQCWWCPFTAMEVIEETYVERQAKWVAENHVGKGTRVRITREFASNEGGCLAFGLAKDGDTPKARMLHQIYVVNDVYPDRIVVGGYSFPYFVLEIEENVYRKLNDEEMKGLYGKTLVDEGGLPQMVTGMMTINGLCVNGENFCMNAEELFDSEYTIDGHKCGVKL